MTALLAPAAGVPPAAALYFTIPGVPHVKGRHRTATKDRKGRPLSKPRHYTDEKTDRFEKNVGWLALEARRRSKVDPSAWRWLELELWIYLDARGSKDGDNVAKAIADGLQRSGVFSNDVKVLDWSIRIRPTSTLRITSADVLVGPRVDVTVKPSHFQGEFARATKAVARA